MAFEELETNIQNAFLDWGEKNNATQFTDDERKNLIGIRIGNWEAIINSFTHADDTPVIIVASMTNDGDFKSIVCRFTGTLLIDDFEVFRKHLKNLPIKGDFSYPNLERGRMNTKKDITPEQAWGLIKDEISYILDYDYDLFVRSQ